MANNTKNAMMVIQELSVKMHWRPPEYVLLSSIIGNNNETEFRYQVSVFNISAIGVGRSKQAAKHKAAGDALEQLRELNLYDSRAEPVKEFNAYQEATNFIGKLEDICVEHKIPLPVLVEISDVGPPHCREFTYECRISSIRTQATANTKKLAKQNAAKDMLERIKDVLPELAAENENIKNSLTENTEKVINMYNSIHPFPDVMPNKSIKVIDFDKTIQNIMEERSLTPADFSRDFGDAENELQDILDMLGLKYKIEKCEYFPSTQFLSLSLDVPFILMKVESNESKCKNWLIEKALEMLKSFIGV